MNVLILTISLAALIIASYMDLKKREVADWLNFFLISAGIGISIIYSIYFLDYRYVFFSIAGFLLSFLIGYFMYYTGQWGGGDSKMLMGLGAILGFEFAFDSFLVKFYINILFAGALYGLAWIIVLFYLHKEKVFKKMDAIFRKKNTTLLRRISFIIILVLLIIIIITPGRILDSQIKLIFFIMLFLLYFMNYLWVFVKAIEKTAMLKSLDVEEVTEGDWIVKDVIIDKKRVCGPSDLGIDKSQISQLLKYKREGKIDKILIKQGIPFIPSFLLAFIYTLAFSQIFLINLLI